MEEEVVTNGQESQSRLRCESEIIDAWGREFSTWEKA